MGLGWLMLFGPAVESASYAFLAPVLAWAVVEPGSGPVRRTLAVTSALLILVLGWNAVGSLLRPAFPAVVAALPLGTCLFLIWLVTRPAPEYRAVVTILSRSARNPKSEIRNPKSEIHPKLRIRFQKKNTEFPFRIADRDTPIPW